MMNNKWIPVTEALPSDGEEVLVFCSTDGWASEDFEFGLAWYCPSFQRWLVNYEGLEPTHWMPLPEAPEGEEE